jgi:hypothetical protein
VGDSARLTLSDQASVYNANGQPERWGELTYTWDALGRLSDVQDKGTPLARYTYDHRGLRVTKSVGQGADPNTTHTTHTLYSEDHSPQAELDAQGATRPPPGLITHNTKGGEIYSGQSGEISTGVDRWTGIPRAH